MLYPLKFEPIYKHRIWGGNKLFDRYDRLCPVDAAIGESWELSGLEGDVSVVANGTLAENDIRELIEVYMGDLVGDKVYREFGEEFPLIVKLIDARDILSIQVHPDTELALKRHRAYGKTEMWYVMDAEPGANLYLGFSRRITPAKYHDALENGKLPEILREFKPEKDRAYFVPAGTVHAIGAGVLLAEIQQASDITYRIFDWNRTDDKGNPRQLHTELADKAIDFDAAENLEIPVKPLINQSVPLKQCDKFTVNIIELSGKMERDYAALDSFVIYLCLEGDAVVECEGGAESLTAGETLLLPAMFDEARLSGKAKLLEVYIP